MKKILIINDNSTSHASGVNTSIEKTMEILRQRGHDVKMIHHGLFRSFSFAPLFPEVSISLFPGRTIKKAVLKEHPDHIHIVTEGTLGLIARNICVKNNIKFTTAYHTHYDLYLKARVSPIFFKITKSYIRWFHSKASAVMVSTESLKSLLKENKYKNDIVISPLGVDVNLFKKPEKEIISKYNKPIFTYLGRLAKEKNVEEFLECDLPGTMLVIGDGPQRKQLENKYKEKAIFLGIKRSRELVDLLSQSDVLVFPSKTDTFGLTIIEALACGVPVAAHDIMGPKDIITHGVDGFLDEDITKASLACLKLNREECRKKAILFSWEHGVDAFLTNIK